MNMKKYGFVAGLVLCSPVLATVSDLQDISVDAGSGIHTGSNFTSRGVGYDGIVVSFGDGFVVSNHTDTTDYGANAFMHQYDAIAGSGAGGSSQYAVGTDFGALSVHLPNDPQSISFTNNTYAYYSMLYGDSFAKKFGGNSGNDPDYFKVTITGLTSGNAIVGSLDFYLADFRFADNSQDYIVSTWQTLDLSSLAGARELQFGLSSSDSGDFGMNTPAYFALDNLAVVPEPGTAAMVISAGLGMLFARRRRHA